MSFFDKTLRAGYVDLVALNAGNAIHCVLAVLPVKSRTVCMTGEALSFDVGSLHSVECDYVLQTGRLGVLGSRPVAGLAALLPSVQFKMGQAGMHRQFELLSQALVTWGARLRAIPLRDGRRCTSCEEQQYRYKPASCHSGLAA
jgi:hypothetical protein